MRGRPGMVFVLSGGVLITVLIPDTEEVTGSIPVSPTYESLWYPRGFVVCQSIRATVRATGKSPASRPVRGCWKRVGLLQVTILIPPAFDLSQVLAAGPWPLALVDLGLDHPLAQRLRPTPNFGPRR